VRGPRVRPACSAMIYDEGDANPMHRRIPGEVVSRRRAPPKEPEEVVVDLRTVTLLKPEGRLKWLTKALKMVTDNTASSTDLYDIVVNRKFVSGMPERVVRKVAAAIQESLDLFSDKQQRYLSSTECPIMARLTARDVAAVFEEDRDVVDGADDEKPPPPGDDSPRAPAPRTSATAAVVAASAAAARSRPKVQEPPSGGSSWTSVKDEWAIRRAEAEAKEHAKRDASKRADKMRAKEKEEEEAGRRAAEAEAEKQRKLAEEADALFDQAIAPPPVPLMSTSSTSERRRADRAERSRSRSISSRTARRMARKSREEKAKHRGGWRGDAPDAVSGSRAIFMNRDFIDDLPHMPRPVLPGVRGIRNRSRSRGR